MHSKEVALVASHRVHVQADHRHDLLPALVDLACAHSGVEIEVLDEGKRLIPEINDNGHFLNVREPLQGTYRVRRALSLPGAFYSG